MPNFTAGPADTRLIRRIARRALDTIPSLRAAQLRSIDLQLDLEMIHCNGCPLQLKALLKAGDYVFATEIAGLRRVLNRNTGQLGSGYAPRFADRAAAPSNRAA